MKKARRESDGLSDLIFWESWVLTYLPHLEGEMELAPFPPWAERLSRLRRAMTLSLSG